MAYDSSKVLTLGSAKTLAQRMKQDYQKKIEETGGTLYSGTKSDLSAPDSGVIEAFFAGADAPTPRKGDVFVVATVVDDTAYERAAYCYTGADWEAMTGAVDADKVILREDITLAGSYTQVGNLSKSQNGTATLNAKGKSVAAVLGEILSKRLQPTITAQPSISGFNLSGAKAVEAGTSLSSGSDNNGGPGFIIGDVGGENVVASLKYRATATHCAGVTAHDNLGGNSDPVVAIAAGTKTKETAAYTPFRNVFYGASTDKPELNSAAIRALTPTGKAYAAGTLTLSVPAGAQRVVIACLASKTGVKKVINQTAMNADVTSTFVKSVVPVEGASGYTAQDYNVWVFEPAVPYENPATLQVTLG